MLAEATATMAATTGSARSDVRFRAISITTSGWPACRGRGLDRARQHRPLRPDHSLVDVVVEDAWAPGRPGDGLIGRHRGVDNGDQLESPGPMATPDPVEAESDPFPFWNVLQGVQRSAPAGADFDSLVLPCMPSLASARSKLARPHAAACPGPPGSPTAGIASPPACRRSHWMDDGGLPPRC